MFAFKIRFSDLSRCFLLAHADADAVADFVRRTRVQRAPCILLYSTTSTVMPRYNDTMRNGPTYRICRCIELGPNKPLLKSAVLLYGPISCLTGFPQKSMLGCNTRLLELFWILGIIKNIGNNCHPSIFNAFLRHFGLDTVVYMKKLNPYDLDIAIR